jgi:hypothetical protein
MTTNHDIPTLPASCIRGPELYDVARIAAELRATDDDALAAYAEGAALLRRAYELLAAETRLAEARRTRAFLIAQLVSLEARDRTQFDTALASYRSVAGREKSGCQPSDTTSSPD